MTLRNYIQTFLIGLVMFVCHNVYAQQQNLYDRTYPLCNSDIGIVISGNSDFYNIVEENIFAKAMMWTICNVCPVMREGISTLDIKGRTFTVNLVLASPEGVGLKNVYYSKMTLQIKENKLQFLISGIMVESKSSIINKVMAFEQLNPQKKENHSKAMDEYERLSSRVVNSMIEYIDKAELQPITHWNEINAGTPIKGMNETECVLAFGKPQSIKEADGEVQWMYSGSFYLFFKDGKVVNVVK